MTCAVVIGTGLIGTSIGLALRSDGAEVHLRDHLLSHARVAEGLGAGTLQPPPSAAVELVVAAVPPRALAGTVEHALATYPAATVTDVGSVKAEVLATLWRTGAALERYVGSHPMAGSQHSGPLTARADLFEDRTWVITPHRRSAPDAVERVRGLVKACRAREVVMDVDDHDAAVAAVSHLPHLMSVLTARQLAGVPDSHLTLAGQGLRDMTRIAGSDPELWSQIVGANAAAVLDRLQSVRDGLNVLIDAVRTGERAELSGLLAEGVAGTRRIPGKHGAAAVAYAQVVVEIPDTPGALARLFSDVEQAGVNVEDVGIEHDQVRQVGYLAVSVVPDRAAGLEARMRALGWNVQA